MPLLVGALAAPATSSQLVLVVTELLSWILVCELSLVGKTFHRFSALSLGGVSSCLNLRHVFRIGSLPEDLVGSFAQGRG